MKLQQLLRSRVKIKTKLELRKIVNFIIVDWYMHYVLHANGRDIECRVKVMRGVLTEGEFEDNRP